MFKIQKYEKIIIKLQMSVVILQKVVTFAASTREKIYRMGIFRWLILADMV